MEPRPGAASRWRRDDETIVNQAEPMKPEVSVIIPTYNRCAMAAEAVASVMAQRGVAFELIVADDGSTDGTIERLRERFADGFIAAADASHRGPAAARNHGVAIARAEFVAFLDSDDLWMPGKLARQLAFMREHPGCAIAQTRELWLRDGRRVNPGLRHRKRSGDIFADSLRTCLISPSAVMMKRELFEAAGGFDENLAACEDYDLWLRLLVDHEVGLLDEPLVIRRAGHPDQLSASTPALDRFRIVALLKLMEMPALGASRRDAVAEVLAEKCLIYANGLARRNKSAEADHYKALARRAMGGSQVTNGQAAITQ